MEKTYLLINPGSASKKYAIYTGGQRQLLVHAETTPAGYLATIEFAGKAVEEKWDEGQYSRALDQVLVIAKQQRLIANPEKDIAAVGVRAVVPGTAWQEHRLLDHLVYEELRQLTRLAPLHLNPLVSELERLFRIMPQAKVITISDSAFHATMPPVAKHYGLPAKLAQPNDLYRFGYHGISVQSVIRRLPEVVGQLPAKVVVCHLGSGTSVTAVLNGQSIDTSMGFSPLAGVITGTRASDLDAGALLYLMRSYQGGLDELEKTLNNDGGLLAISEQSEDIRQLLQLSDAKDTKATLAIELYTYQVRKYIGAYMSALGGLDLLVFTATVGERSAVIRQKICQLLSGLGIILDQSANEQLINGEGSISAPDSTSVAVVKTDELGEMARIVAKLENRK